MAALVVFLLTAPSSFAAGWVLRGHCNRTKGKLMNATTGVRLRARIGQIVDWLADARKLVALAVIVGMLSAGGIVYTWATDRSSDRQTEARIADSIAGVVSCVATYVRDTSEQQAPRTAASVAANDARRDWDAGHSDEVPGLTEAQLKERYLRLYAVYVAVRGDNPPLPAFSLSYCDGGRR